MIDWQCWSWKDNVLIIEVVVNLWQSQLCKVNFVQCIEMSVNDWLCW